MEIRLKHGLWGEKKEIKFLLPDNWNISFLEMNGDRKHVLDDNEIKNAVLSIMPLIKEKLTKSCEICVVFDDLSRPTKAYKIIPYLIELLDRFHIREEQVRFLCGGGTHAALDNNGFRKKLGEETLERFTVYNHNPYENCEYIGKTGLGTPVIINKEYLLCDVRIGIGSFTPHAFCGFGGGYKIIMPALSHIDSIEYHHGKLLQNYRESCFSLGKYKNNLLLDDIIESGRIAGLDIKIDCLINTSADITDIYAGKPDDLYNYMLNVAPIHYYTNIPYKADIVFANSLSKANEAVISLSVAESLLKDNGGDIVLLCDVPEGQIVHYLFGRFGKTTWGRLPFGIRKKPDKVRNVFIYSRHKDKANEFWFGIEKNIYWSKDLEEIVKIIEKEYKKKTPDVLILPDATIQNPINI
ncbi:MAG TPA: lactate racemase domain-containing protein [Syntrophorhabdaceae bacterium]|nr:lactate racemase domain-containing protein [Syntrophorhabdaceae bacterium]